LSTDDRTWVFDTASNDWITIDQDVASTTVDPLWVNGLRSWELWTIPEKPSFQNRKERRRYWDQKIGKIHWSDEIALRILIISEKIGNRSAR